MGVERMLRMRALALVCVMAISLTCLSVPDYEFADAGEPVVWERTKAPATDPMNFGVTKSISKSISKLKFRHHAPKPKLPRIPHSGKHHHKFHVHRPGQKKFLPKIKMHKTRSFGIKKRSFGIKKRSVRSKTRHLSIKIPKIPRIPHSLGRPTKLGHKKRKTRTSAKPKEKKSKKAAKASKEKMSKTSKKEKAAKKLAAAKAKEKCAKEKKKKKAAKKKAKEVKTKERTKKNRKLRASERKAKSLLKEKSNKLRFAKKETKQEKLLVRKVKAKCERRVK